MSLNPNATPAPSKATYVREQVPIIEWLGEAKPCVNKPDRYMQVFAAKINGERKERIAYGDADDFVAAHPTLITRWRPEQGTEWRFAPFADKSSCALDDKFGD